MIHTMKLDAEPFEKIKNGSKTVELRLFDEKRQKIKPGDIIEFFVLICNFFNGGCKIYFFRNSK